MTPARPRWKYRPLVIGAIALVALPLAMHAVGLTVNTASVVVILAVVRLVVVVTVLRRLRAVLL